MNKKNRRITLKSETIRVLEAREVAQIRAGVMCSTGAFTGTCPPQTPACPKTK